VKTVENRSKPTKYRGKLLIHASGNPLSFPDSRWLPENYQKELYQRMDDPDQESAWKDAPQSMLAYCDLLRYVWKFYGHDIDDGSSPDDFLTKKNVEKYGWALPSQAVVGFCDLVDCVQDSKDDFAEEGMWHWILDDEYYFEKPVTNVLGHLGLWNFDMEDDIYER
jgi:hypothetical protein